jgi:hypothetical protein
MVHGSGHLVRRLSFVVVAAACVLKDGEERLRAINVPQILQ